MADSAAQSIEDLSDPFNAAADLVASGLRHGCRDGIAIVDRIGKTSFGKLADAVARMARVYADMGIEREQRVLICLPDSAAFHIAFLGAIHAGVIPVPVNTLLGADDFSWLLVDSQARGVVVSTSYQDAWRDALAMTGCRTVLWVSDDASDLHRRLQDAEPAPPVESRRDETAFWLYTSGSTGRPKAALHTHAALRLTANLFGLGALGITAQDRVLSVAKLFFAYGLGNSLTFPLAAGATAILCDERPTPAAIAKLAARHEVTLLCGVPTFFAGMLASTDLPELQALRLATSAGEPLRAHLGEAFKARFGADIIDGLGSTELLHIFIAQPINDVRYGRLGQVVPGYEVRVLDSEGHPCPPGVPGELWVRGPTAATGYWHDRPRTLDTFVGAWTRTRDQCVSDADGWITHLGRNDDMLKVSGQYVSPHEIEAAIGQHAAVLEVAVFGQENAEGLIKPIAHVVLRPGYAAEATLAEAIIAGARSRLAPHKYPRQVVFVDSLPKTATGKVQRYKLRARV